MLIFLYIFKLGCKGGSGAMEESGLMGGGQGDGPADSHPTSGTGNQCLGLVTLLSVPRDSVMRGIFFKANIRYRKLVFGLSKPF
jgi:hypothetical protein